jgi:hypothetical protein
MGPSTGGRLEAPSRMSSIKLGWSIAWPAFWTGVPIRLAGALLLLAMGVPPWETPGLALFLLFSIPVDIWATSLSARTVFLERLRLEPPEGVGLMLWAQGVGLTALYLPLAYFMLFESVGVAKGIAASILERFNLPVAERISIELVLWGAPATIVLIALVLGWLWGFGWLVRRQAAAARPAGASLPALVRRWDLLRVPADQGLMLTAFTAAGAVAVLVFWAAIPVSTPHPHESYKKPADKAAPLLRPADALQKTERVIAQAESALATLEKVAGDKDKAGKDKTSKDGAAEPTGLKRDATPPQAQPASAASTHNSADHAH